MSRELPIAALSLLLTVGFYYAVMPLVKVTSLTDAIKEVDVGDRPYIITRLGDGKYSVMRKDDPSVTYTFGQEGVIAQTGNTNQLQRDMGRFPKELFT